MSLRNIETNGSYVLGTVDEISMQNPIMVKKVRLQVPSDSIDLIQDSLTWAVNQEECLKITIKEDLTSFSSVPEPITTSYISSFSLESVSIDSDGRIFQTYGDSGVEYSYDFYLKDHLGSTRMVINSQDQITEAVAYQTYGGMVPLDSIANAPEIPAREKFTGKEFDQEGEDSANGVVGIQAYHFGARVYDPEVGVWLAVDPAYQDFNVYGYCAGNPIILVDPNGEFWDVALAIGGAVIGAYAGGAMANGSFNPGDWNWEDPSTFLGMVQGGISGGMMGYGIGSQIDASLMARTMNSPLGRNIMDQGGVAGAGSNNSLASNGVCDACVTQHNGQLTLKQANSYYRYGQGQAVLVDANTVDLSRVSVSDFPKGPGSSRPFNLAGKYYSSLNDALVYGNVNVKLIEGNTVKILPDIYDFDQWAQPAITKMPDLAPALKVYSRNWSTFFGEIVAGQGQPFIINFMGNTTITP